MQKKNTILNGIPLIEVDGQCSACGCEAEFYKMGRSKYGLKLYRNFHTAYESFMRQKKAAEKGSLSALTKMGSIYTDGKLVQKDLNEAIRWYIKAAESGSSIAQNNLAWILATSKNPEIRDGSKAITWANQAIDNSNRQEASYFGTLAAAYAESGQFSKAIEVQKKAISLIKSNENVESYKSALQSYKEKRPLREDF